MYFQFLIEDKSSEELISVLMKKIIAECPTTTYSCKSFKGIGGFSKKGTPNDVKSGKLLNDLSIYLRGFDKSLKGIDAVLVVVVDNDNRTPEAFREELERLAKMNMILMDYVFCIAVEEVEAWLLGDAQAILKAYPHAKTQVINSYVQDSICGTWEVLADAIYPGGVNKLKKISTSYMEIGKHKCEWARNIGQYMNFDSSKSPSFQYFVEELFKRLEMA